MAKKFTAIILSCVIIASLFSACTTSSSKNEKVTLPETTTQAVVTDDDNFKLSYTQSDSLDPFKSKTQNNQVLSTLVFQSLFKLDESFSAVNDIATGYEYTSDKSLKVTINNSIPFSNGELLTASDVTYSFNAAKSSPAYKNNLAGISSVSRVSDNTVVFNLEYENPYAQNVLTFPIASTKDTDDGFPIGSGRYIYLQTSDGVVLSANTTNNFTPHITTIHLQNIASADSIDNAVNIGNISYMFRDMSTNTSARMTATKKPININNMVYIGVNNKSGITSNAQIRKAISLALDRSTVAKSAYSGYAKPSTSIYNPSFELSKSTKIFSDETDSSASRQAIAQSGIASNDLKLTLLVNDNQNRQNAASLIKTQLEAVGFSVNIVSTNTKEYKALIKAENFSLYLGETKLSDDMSFYSFFSTDGQTKYGINLTDNQVITDYTSYMNGDTELGNFILNFNENMPFIPVVYRYGMICYSKSLSGDMQGYYNNYFSNIEDWYFAN